MNRLSTPPTAEKLEASTERLRAHNDRLESGVPTVTDSQRLEVVRELWRLHITEGRLHMDATLNEYERITRERMR